MFTVPKILEILIFPFFENSRQLMFNEWNFLFFADCQYSDMVKDEDGGSHRFLTYLLTLNYTIGPKHSDTTVKQVWNYKNLLLITFCFHGNILLHNTILEVFESFLCNEEITRSSAKTGFFFSWSSPRHTSRTYKIIYDHFKYADEWKYTKNHSRFNEIQCFSFDRFSTKTTLLVLFMLLIQR